jgi:hypothetical protein
MPFAGFIDKYNAFEVIGWAWDDRQPDRAVDIEIIADNQILASITADQHRKDVETAYGYANHGFTFRLPYRLASGTQLHFRIAGTDFLLGNGPITIPGSSALPHVERVVATTNRLQQGQGAGVCILAINQPGGNLAPLQRNLIEGLRACDLTLVLVNSSTLKMDEFIHTATPLVDAMVFHDNRGRDFASWAIASRILQQNLGKHERIYFVNDSIIGPFSPLAPILRLMNGTNCDVWGLTDSWERHYHLQSYFLSFTRSAFFSEPMRWFLEKYPFPTDKNDVIRYGEIALSEVLLEGGLTLKAAFPYSEVARKWLENYLAACERQPFGFAADVDEWHAEVAGSILRLKPKNPTHYFWDTLIRSFGFPFIKKELLTKNPSKVPNLFELSGTICHLPGYDSAALQDFFLHQTQGVAPPSLDSHDLSARSVVPHAVIGGRSQGIR